MDQVYSGAEGAAGNELLCDSLAGRSHDLISTVWQSDLVDCTTQASQHIDGSTRESELKQMSSLPQMLETIPLTELPKASGAA